MKFKSFMAMLVAGLLCVASFSACSDDDDDKDKTYAYEMVLELTDAGDLSQDNIQVLNTTFATMESQVGTQHATPAKEKQIFKENVSEIKNSIKTVLAGMSHTKTVKVTFGFFNTGTQKLEVSQVFEFN